MEETTYETTEKKKEPIINLSTTVSPTPNLPKGNQLSGEEKELTSKPGKKKIKVIR